MVVRYACKYSLNPFLFQVSYFGILLPYFDMPCQESLNPFLFQVSYFFLQLAFMAKYSIIRLNPFLFQVSYFDFINSINNLMPSAVLIPFCFRSLISVNCGQVIEGRNMS